MGFIDNLTTREGKGAPVSASEWDANLDAISTEFDKWVKVAVPASTTSTGEPGNYAYDTTHFYVCVATNTWRRCDLSTWSNVIIPIFQDVQESGIDELTFTVDDGSSITQCELYEDGAPTGNIELGTGPSYVFRGTSLQVGRQYTAVALLSDSSTKDSVNDGIAFDKL